jgi:hypothetical protein
MIRGNIAIPDSPKTRPSRARKRYKKPAPISVVAIPQQVRKGPMLAHLLDDITPAEHKRRADAADALFREIARRARNVE